jgi:hypothetical protein
MDGVRDRSAFTAIASQRLDSLSALIAACNFVTLAAFARSHGLCSRKIQHLGCCDAQSVSARGQFLPPSLATAMEELASTPDANARQS